MLLYLFSDYFLGQLNAKHFNELWIRRNDSIVKNRFGSHIENRRLYYILVVLITISLFVLIIHKISQRLLRVMVIPKAYDQIVLPNYL